MNLSLFFNNVLFFVLHVISFMGVARCLAPTGRLLFFKGGVRPTRLASPPGASPL